MGKYYTIQQTQNGEKAVINIFGNLTPYRWEESDVSAYAFKAEIDKLNVQELEVRINSPGGFVSEGFAVYNALKAHPARVTTYSDGFVASAAIYPFLAGDVRIANPVSAFYFHQVQLGAYGNSEELRKAADQADLLNEQGLQAFAAVGVSAETAKELELRDSFVTPEEVVKLGIATELGNQKTENEASQSILPALIKLLLREDAGKMSEQLIKGPPDPDKGNPVGLVPAMRAAGEGEAKATQSGKNQTGGKKKASLRDFLGL